MDDADYDSHFDHLDPEAIHELGDSCEWIVPIGVGPFIRQHGVTRVTELEQVKSWNT
jgi:N-acyl-phosphatidylethanolamine-hydrolysing phospholipase D